MDKNMLHKDANAAWASTWTCSKDIDMGYGHRHTSWNIHHRHGHTAGYRLGHQCGHAAWTWTTDMLQIVCTLVTVSLCAEKSVVPHRPELFIKQRNKICIFLLTCQLPL